MFSRTIVCLLAIVFLISFIFTLNNSLTRNMMIKKLCLKNVNHTRCQEMTSSHTVAMFSSEKILKDADEWSRIFNTSSLALSIIGILVISVATALTWKKEYVGLYVATVLATQSLVYLILSVLKAVKIKHLFTGVVLNSCVGSEQGAILFAWVFVVAETDNNLSRSFAFVCVAGMVNIGIAAGQFSAMYLPQYVPSLSYIFAGAFTLSLVIYMLIFFILPTFEDIIISKHGSTVKQYYLDSSKGLFYSLVFPGIAIKREYVAGIILTAFLTQLGNSFFFSVILQYLLDPPLSLPYENSIHYLWIMTAGKGVLCVLTTLVLVKILFASDTTMVLMSLSCSAFWMALIAYTGSETMLYILTVCLAGFLPIGIVLLQCIASKEFGALTGHFPLILGLTGSLGLLSQALLTYNSHIFIDANRKIFHTFTLLLAGVLQLMAFIVMASISWTYNKPLVEMSQLEETGEKQQSIELDGENETLLKE